MHPADPRAEGAERAGCNIRVRFGLCAFRVATFSSCVPNFLPHRWPHCLSGCKSHLPVSVLRFVSWQPLPRPIESQHAPAEDCNNAGFGSHKPRPTIVQLHCRSSTTPSRSGCGGYPSPSWSLAHPRCSSHVRRRCSGHTCALFAIWREQTVRLTGKISVWASLGTPQPAQPHPTSMHKVRTRHSRRTARCSATPPRCMRALLCTPPLRAHLAVACCG